MKDEVKVCLIGSSIIIFFNGLLLKCGNVPIGCTMFNYTVAHRHIGTSLH